MARKKGKIAYVPPFVEEELNNIKMENDIQSTAEAFRKMAKNSMLQRMNQGKKKDEYRGLRF